MPTNITEYARIALYAALIAIVLALFQAWDKEHAKNNAAPAVETSTASNYVPQVIDNTVATNQTASVAEAHPAPETAAKLIHVKTDLLEVAINPVGGNIMSVDLLNYPESLHSDQPFELLNNSAATRYIAQSGLLSATGPDTQKGQALYSVEQSNYQLANNQNELQVKLHWKNAAGVMFTKIFTFKRNDYAINMDYQVTNSSKQSWQGNLYLQLMRKNTPPVTKQGFMNLSTYFGAAVSSPEKKYQKITFKQMDTANLNQTIKGGWAAMVQHYFVSAWVPSVDSTSQYFSRVTPDGLYTVGMIGPNIQLAPGQTYDTAAKFYAGPASSEQLEKVAPGLQLTIDYGWLWIISAAIFWMMQKIYNVVGNWGWAIVIVTLVIKLLFFHLSAKSYRSMSAMKNLQPRINALKEKFGDDKQKFTQGMLELYKKEKVNPMSGCLPVLVQIPVFIALYWVLIESVQLRQAPFIFWIHDLSQKDPYYILPLLVGLSMFLQQRLNPPPPDPMQAKVMMAMPIVFTILFVNFPAGLMLYWFVNTTLSVLQQWFIMRSTKIKIDKKVKK